MQLLAGLGEIADRYDAFIVDLWGVVHDGIRPYPAAIDCLDRLLDRPVLLLSNAPRRASSARSMLRRMGVPDRLTGLILTSGEATWLALRDRTDPWFARLGRQVYHLGPQRDRSVLDGLGLEIVASPAEATFVLNTGPDDDLNDPRDLDAFLPELEACLTAGLPMICANPDLVVMRGGVRILCAGALAAHYRQAGGDVVCLGKPHRAIYDMALSMLGVSPGRILAIGDSLHTDIAGAACAGLDAAWVLDGIHGEAIAGQPERAADLAVAAGLQPAAMLWRLAW